MLKQKDFVILFFIFSKYIRRKNHISDEFDNLQVRLMHGEIEVVDKDIGERGSCFRLNVILSVCENKENQIDPLRIIAHGLDPSPKRKGSPSTTQIGKFSKSPGSSRNIDQQIMTKVESEIKK